MDNFIWLDFVYSFDFLLKIFLRENYAKKKDILRVRLLVMEVKWYVTIFHIVPADTFEMERRSFMRFWRGCSYLMINKSLWQYSIQFRPDMFEMERRTSWDFNVDAHTRWLIRVSTGMNIETYQWSFVDNPYYKK